MTTMSKGAERTEFWRLFKSRLDALDITQAYVAERLGMSRQGVNAWGRGALPETETIPRLAELLGLSAAGILAAVNASKNNGATSTTPVAQSDTHVVRPDLARKYGVDEAALLHRAVDVLDALRDVLGTKKPREASSPNWGAGTMESAQSGSDDGGGDIWDALTPDQRYGLALLIEGRSVDPLDIRAALKSLDLLKPAAAPAAAPARRDLMTLQLTARDEGVSSTRALRPSAKDGQRKRTKPRAAR